MPLQPTDVPSREGIQEAIDEAVANSADPNNVSGPDYDSGWLNIPSTGRNAALGVTTAQYRIYRGMIQVQGHGVLASSYNIGTDGNGADLKVGEMPSGARPGGMGISTWFFGEGPGQMGLRFVIYNGGSFNLGGADARGAAYTIASGSTWQFMSGLYTINS